MATVSKTRYTPEDLLEIRDRPMPELVDGVLIDRPKGIERDSIACQIMVLIGNQVAKKNLGVVNGSRCGFQIFEDDPEKVRVSDASFTSRERISRDRLAQGHARVAPNLIVEVTSLDGSADQLESKINDYLTAGVMLIWVVYPISQTVIVHRANGSLNRLQANDILDGGDVLPGFEVEVSRLFP